MFSQELVKPDGRKLTLYSRRPIPAGIVAPSPSNEPVAANPHLRWHPLRGEWIAYTGYHRNPKYAATARSCLSTAVQRGSKSPELPAGDYDMAVFASRFPALCVNSHDPPKSIVATAPADGRCETVVFSQDPARPLAALPLVQLELLLAVWADRTREISGFKQVKYVLPFENRTTKAEVGPHQSFGQICAYPFIPPVPAIMRKHESRHYRTRRRTLLETLIQEELAAGVRILYAGPHAVAFVPAWSRYPYEVWIAPIRAAPDFVSLTPEQCWDLARALKTVLMKYEGLWQRPFPYFMAWYQAPTDDIAHPECHLHAEFCPPYRTSEELEHLAAAELGAGMFANDAFPEDQAAELQAVDVDIEAMGWPHD